MAVGAAIASIVVAAGAAAYSAKQQRDQAQDAKKESKKQAAAALGLQQEAKDASERTIEQGARQQTLARQRALAYSATSNPNIQTSPLGVPGAPAATGPKTLLGM